MIKRPPTVRQGFKEDTDLPIQEQIKEPEIKGTKQIHVDEKKITDETVQMDFVDSAYGADMSSKQTKIADDAPKIDPNTPADKVRDQVKQYEEGKTKTLTFKHYQEIAEFLIHIMDVGMSNALNWIAKDTARQAYTLPAQDKKSLSDQFALILCKYQSKMSIEFTFLLALVVIYSGPVMTALRKKKENAALPTAQAKIDNPDKAYVRHIPMSKPVDEIKKVQQEELKKEVTYTQQAPATTAPIVNVVNRPPSSRRRGGQRKA